GATVETRAGEGVRDQLPVSRNPDRRQAIPFRPDLDRVRVVSAETVATEVGHRRPDGCDAHVCPSQADEVLDSRTAAERVVEEDRVAWVVPKASLRGDGARRFAERPELEIGRASRRGGG